MDSKYDIICKPSTNGTSKQPFKLESIWKNKQIPKEMTIKRKSPVAPAPTSILKKIKLGNANADNPMSRNSLLEQKRSLPVYNVRENLMKELENRQTIIIVGETGSGKTTQIPQLLHEHGYTRTGMIGVTQPRRVAAITVSRRVAAEMSDTLGNTVGYKVRFEDAISENTKIKFMTDGVLLREALLDKQLRKYSVIILDEAHERTIATDILFGIIKEAQRMRRISHDLPDLKIIIMSATMDVDHFSKYFNSCEVLYLEGRTYDIKYMHLKLQQSDYLNACLGIVLDLHQNAPVNHDFLVFLTGQDEIEAMANTLRSVNAASQGVKMRVFPLYAALPYRKQMEVFMPAAPHSRKIILATNIAETSITIKGIKYVIDSGVVKIKLHDPTTGIDTLKVTKISKAQALQRAGRAGRESDGFCYRAYTIGEFETFDENTIPEIRRCNLAAVALQLLNLNIDCTRFDFIDAPPENAKTSAVKELFALGAVDDLHEPKLTDLGRKMCKFPLDPQYSKMILAAPAHNCLEEMVNLIAVLSSENIFAYPTDKRDQAREKHAKFEAKQGDHITLLRAFRAYLQTEKVNNWTRENFLNIKHLEYAKKVREQLLEICDRLHLPRSACGADTDPVRRCLLAGLYGNIAELHTDNHYITILGRQRVKIHPSSVFSDKEKPKFIVFSELIATGRIYVRTVTAVEQDWVQDMMPMLQNIKYCSFGA